MPESSADAYSIAAAGPCGFAARTGTGSTPAAAACPARGPMVDQCQTPATPARTSADMTAAAMVLDCTLEVAGGGTARPCCSVAFMDVLWLALTLASAGVKEGEVAVIGEELTLDAGEGTEGESAVDA